MDNPKDTSHPIANRVLASLARDEYDRLFPNPKLIHLRRNRVLYETGDEVSHAYFLNEGLASLLAVTEDGQTVDVCTIGTEGMIGLPIILNVPIVPCRVVTQLPCDVLIIKSQTLLAEFNRGGTLQKLLLKYAYAQQSQAIQASVCHALHTIRQRLCRWLLIVSDSARSETLDLTQEHIANMLGHQRNRITLSARELLSEGLIEYRSGTLKILDRLGLEAAACECYRIIKELLGSVMVEDRQLLNNPGS